MFALKLMPVDRLMKDREKDALDKKIMNLLTDIRSKDSSINFSEWLAKDALRVMVYNYGVAMKVNGLGHDEIVHNAKAVIQSIFRFGEFTGELSIRKSLRPIYERSILINMLSPFQDELSRLSVTTDELCGVYSDDVQIQILGDYDFLAGESLIESVMGPAIALHKYKSQRWNFFSTMLSHLRESSYPVGFDVASSGINRYRNELYSMLNDECGITPALEKQLADQSIEMRFFDRLVTEISTNRLSISAKVGMLSIMLKAAESPEEHLSLKNGLLTDSSRVKIRLRQYKSIAGEIINEEESVKKALLKMLMSEDRLNLKAFELFGFAEAEMRQMGKNATPEIKRYVISRDLSL